VKGVLEAELSKIQGEVSETASDANRLESLAAVAGVQAALADARRSRQTQAPEVKPSDFTIYTFMIFLGLVLQP